MGWNVRFRRRYRRRSNISEGTNRMSIRLQGLRPQTIIIPLGVAIVGLLLVAQLVPTRDEGGGLWPLVGLFAVVVAVVYAALLTLSASREKKDASETNGSSEQTERLGFQGTSSEHRPSAGFVTSPAFAAVAVVTVTLTLVAPAVSCETKAPTQDGSRHSDKAANETLAQGASEKAAG